MRRLPARVRGAGGKIVQKMFRWLTVPDYGTYLAHSTNIDGIFRLRRR
jgi:hypothetical protein